MNSRYPDIFIAGLLTVVFQVAHAGNAEPAPCTALQNTTSEVKKSTAASEEVTFESAYAYAECLRQTAVSKNAEWLKTEEILSRSRDEAEKIKAAASTDIDQQITAAREQKLRIRLRSWLMKM